MKNASNLFIIFIVAAVFTVLGFTIGVNQNLSNIQTATQTVQNTPKPIVYNRDDVLTAINEYRLKIGLQTLAPDPRLDNLALYSSELSCGEKIGHEGFRRLISEGKISDAMYSEIVAKGYSPDQAVDAWIKSPTHKEILDNTDRSLAGIAIVDDCFLVLLRQ